MTRILATLTAFVFFLSPSEQVYAQTPAPPHKIDRASSDVAFSLPSHGEGTIDLSDDPSHTPKLDFDLKIAIRNDSHATFQIPGYFSSASLLPYITYPGHKEVPCPPIPWTGTEEVNVVMMPPLLAPGGHSEFELNLSGFACPVDISADGFTLRVLLRAPVVSGSFEEPNGHVIEVSAIHAYPLTKRLAPSVGDSSKDVIATLEDHDIKNVIAIMQHSTAQALQLDFETMMTLENHSALAFPVTKDPSGDDYEGALKLFPYIAYPGQSERPCERINGTLGIPRPSPPTPLLPGKATTFRLNLGMFECPGDASATSFTLRVVLRSHLDEDHVIEVSTPPQTYALVQGKPYPLHTRP